VAVHEAVLPPGTAAVAELLAQWRVMDHFYLAGGSALALHLGHRQSRDLDFFTRDPEARLPALSDLESALAHFHSIEWEIKTAEQIQCRLDGVSVTLWAYPFSHRFAFRPWRGLAVADARDIAVQKAYTVGRRAQARDDLDLHAVLTRGIVSLDDLLVWAHETYREAFSPRLFLQQLTYTADIPDRDAALALLVHPTTFDAVAADLGQLVRDWSLRRFHQAPPRPRDLRL
jgi:hypothetical protein